MRCRPSRRVAGSQPSGHPRAAHVDRSQLALAPRPTWQRVQGRGGAWTRGMRHPETRPQLLHRDLARGRAAWRRPPDPGHRRSDDQPLRVDVGAHGGKPRVRRLGRLRRNSDFRPGGTGRNPVPGGADPRDGPLRSPWRIRHRGRHRERPLGRRIPTAPPRRTTMTTEFRRFSWVLAFPLLALAACTSSASSADGWATNVDRKVDPCTDFDAFANGPWRAANPIPAQASRWGRRAAARETNRRQVQELLEGLSHRNDWPHGSIERLLSDHYASCMDEAGIERLGLTPLAPLLADIDAIRSPADLQ